MNTDKVIRELENRGYTVSDESGVLMISGKYLNLDEALNQIRKDLEALDFHGSWGTKGYPKGKVPKMTVPMPAEKTAEPVDADEPYETDDAEEDDVIDEAPDTDVIVDKKPETDAHADAESEAGDTEEYLDDSDDFLDDGDDTLEGLDHIREINDFDSDDFGQMSFNFL